MSSSGEALSSSDHILFDLPVSNNGARVRAILYYKQLSKEQVNIVSPMKFGGLKSEEYMTLSPQGLMPALIIQKDHESGMKHLSESDTIARYLLAEYSSVGPSFLPDHPRSNQICRWHDVYLTTIQGCLYKPASRFPLGDYADRKSAISAVKKHLKIIESFMSDEGMYLCGDEVSLADASLFPTCIFANYMLPKFDATQPPLPPKLNAWFDNLRNNDSVFSRIYDEIMDTLVTSWEETNHRWDSIWLAGKRDEAPATIFDKIIAGDIPAAIVKQDDHILAFKDINPVAPAHILVIPKDRNGLTNLRKASAEHIDILGRLLVAAGEIANNSDLGFGDGARIVINDGYDGGQEVNHVHVHVLGGRRLGAMG
jgi:histidine triad (HIT) family protein